MRATPTVSVIVSAYNRPHVIPFALKSVLASDFEDWEMIVVGDACNAATEEAVRAFTDRRIRFHNLPVNTGHQSAPHNKGVELASGEFVLFLNQDDMYFPDHISKRVAFMRATDADISWSPILALQHSGLEEGPVDPKRDRLSLDGAVADGTFNPRSFVISSCWAVRREICHEVGPWLQARETRLAPSQEWLHRAHCQGWSMAYHPYVSVLCIYSGVRRYSYLSPQSFEHERAWTWLTAGPGERANLMQCVAVHEASEIVALREALTRRRGPLRTLTENALAKLGFHPDSVQRYLDGLGRGAWVASHSRFTSEPPELALNTRLRVGKCAVDALFGRGWHAGEGPGRWTATATAEIFFRLPAQPNDAGPLMLVICGHTLRAEDTTTFALNDGAPIARTIGSADKVTAIPLRGSGTFRLTIGVENPTSRQELGISNDSRILGYWLTWLGIVSAAAPGGAASPATQD